MIDSLLVTVVAVSLGGCKILVSCPFFLCVHSHYFILGEKVDPCIFRVSMDEPTSLISLNSILQLTIFTTFLPTASYLEFRLPPRPIHFNSESPPAHIFSSFSSQNFLSVAVHFLNFHLYSVLFNKILAHLWNFDWEWCRQAHVYILTPWICPLIILLFCGLALIPTCLSLVTRIS